MLLEIDSFKQILERQEKESKYEEPRIKVWLSGVQMFEKHPYFGIGPGAFPRLNEQMGGSGHSAHNTPLTLLVEYGVFGFIVLTILTGLYFKGMFFSMPFLLLILLFYANVFTFHSARMLWCLLGVFSGLSRKDEKG